jgi:hypothetical protein
MNSIAQLENTIEIVMVENNVSGYAPYLHHLNCVCVYIYICLTSGFITRWNTVGTIPSNFNVLPNRASTLWHSWITTHYPVSTWYFWLMLIVNWFNTPGTRLCLLRHIRHEYIEHSFNVFFVESILDVYISFFSLMIFLFFYSLFFFLKFDF